MRDIFPLVTIVYIYIKKDLNFFYLQALSTGQFAAA